MSTFTNPVSQATIEQQVKNALNEDLGMTIQETSYHEDVTANILDDKTVVTATIISRENGVLCGKDWVERSFILVSPSIKIKWFCSDGDRIKPGKKICEIKGQAKAILTAERTALNFLQTLSATATQTAEYMDIISHTECKILDTRKTIPGLRLAQKYAVKCGGGVNHRIGLFDMVLIKENHIIAAGSINNAVNKSRESYPDLKIEVEVENLDELKQAIDCKVNRILLDNMDIPMLKKAVEINASQVELEASGNITLENIKAVAETGVNYISTGSITKNIRAIDYSLRITEKTS